MLPTIAVKLAGTSVILRSGVDADGEGNESD